MKKTLALILALALCVALAAPALADDTPHVEISRQTLKVDGELVKCQKYNIGGSNYFKLRDLAALLSYTGSQFGVGWDAATNTVTITKGGEYDWMGKEMLLGADASATAQRSAQTILIDGEEVTDLDVYNIGGSNYFKLRDLGGALGFDVDYDADTDTAIVKSRPEKYLVSKESYTSTYSDWTWDENDEAVEETGKATFTTTYTYTAAGLIASETRVADIVLDSGKAYTETETTTYTYDAAGNMTSRKFESEDYSYTETNTYDAKGNLVKRTYVSDYGSEDTTTYTYNDKGLLAEELYESDGYSYTTVYAYDARNNKTSEKTTYPDGDTSSTVYTYDDAGNCLTEEYAGYGGDSRKTVSTYNAAGQLLTATDTSKYGDGDGDTSVQTITYDAAGNRVKEEYHSTSVWNGETSEYSYTYTYTYDAGGRVLRSESANSDGSTSVSEYTYDDAGRELTWKYTGTSEDASTMSSEYSYDAQGRPVTIAWTDEDGTVTTTNTYDANGNIIKSESTDGYSHSWEYIENKA